MPAAQPSKASVSNVLAAIVAAGLQPGAVVVAADGSFRVDLAGSDVAPSGQGGASGQRKLGPEADEAPGWEDGT
jgi:hypothetical protein